MHVQFYILTQILGQIGLLVLAIQDQKTYTVTLKQVLLVIPLFLQGGIQVACVDVWLFQQNLLMCQLFTLIMVVLKPINRIDSIIIGLQGLGFVVPSHAMLFMMASFMLSISITHVKKVVVPVFPIQLVVYILVQAYTIMGIFFL